MSIPPYLLYNQALSIFIIGDYYLQPKLDDSFNVPRFDPLVFGTEYPKLNWLYTIQAKQPSKLAAR